MLQRAVDIAAATAENRANLVHSMVQQRTHPQQTQSGNEASGAVKEKLQSERSKNTWDLRWKATFDHSGWQPGMQRKHLTQQLRHDCMNIPHNSLQALTIQMCYNLPSPPSPSLFSSYSFCDAPGESSPGGCGGGGRRGVQGEGPPSNSWGQTQTFHNLFKAISCHAAVLLS